MSVVGSIEITGEAMIVAMAEHLEEKGFRHDEEWQVVYGPGWTFAGIQFLTLDSFISALGFLKRWKEEGNNVGS